MVGARLGPYEVTVKLGAGGMGEVWRATDSRLRREVAIKVLPAAFTADRERLARFEREAQTLAALNHPNIAAIYGLERGTETRFTLEPETEWAPTWSPDGRWIYYGSRGHADFKDHVRRSGGDVRFGKPVGLVSTTAVQDADSLAIGPDGRIWMVQFGEEQGEPLRRIENWAEALPR